MINDNRSESISDRHIVYLYSLSSGRAAEKSDPIGATLKLLEWVLYGILPTLSLTERD